MELIPVHELPLIVRVEFFQTHWGGTDMVISSGRYDCPSLDGFAVLEGEEIRGWVSYIDNGEAVEIISLDSLDKDRGIGTFLVQAVEKEADRLGRVRVEVITTNDNLKAIAFYQKRGFRLRRVIPDAVAKARVMKPEIPEVGHYGIPILDELFFDKRW